MTDERRTTEPERRDDARDAEREPDQIEDLAPNDDDAQQVVGGTDVHPLQT